MSARRGYRPLTDSQIRQFRDYGFVKIAGLLTSIQINELRAAMATALSSLAASPNSYDVTAAADGFWQQDATNDNQGSSQHDLDALARAVRNSTLPRLVDAAGDGPRGRFLLDTGVWRRVPGLARFATESRLGAIAAELLDAEAIRFYDDQLFVKEPGAVDRAAFHQDFSYFHLDRPSGCVFWIPVDQVERGGGRMGYIPASHRWGEIFKPNIFVSALPFPGSEGANMPPVNEEPDRFGAEFVEAEPGDVIVHHFLTVHGSEGNRLARPRQAFSLRYVDAEARYCARRGAPAQPLHVADQRGGDRLDDDIHPIVWRRSTC